MSGNCGDRFVPGPQYTRRQSVVQQKGVAEWLGGNAVTSRSTLTARFDILRAMTSHHPLHRWTNAVSPICAIVIAALSLCSGCRNDAPPGYRPSHEHARYLDIGRVRFDDGDTFLLDGEPVRILGIDTPETRSPEVGIFEDQPFGRAAAESTRALMNRARLLEWVPDGEDYYGRRLAHVLVDGELLGVKLIEMGLAYETVSYYGDNGFPDLADRILQASLRAPKPPFQPPYKWRKKHQQKQ